MTFFANRCLGVVVNLVCEPGYARFIQNTGAELTNKTQANFTARFDDDFLRAINGTYRVARDICRSSSDFYFTGDTNCASNVINGLNQLCVPFTSSQNCPPAPSNNDESSKNLILLFSIFGALFSAASVAYCWRNRGCFEGLFSIRKANSGRTMEILYPEQLEPADINPR